MFTKPVSVDPVWHASLIPIATCKPVDNHDFVYTTAGPMFPKISNFSMKLEASAMRNLIGPIRKSMMEPPMVETNLIGPLTVMKKYTP